MELTENQKAWLGTVYDEAIREHRASADNEREWANGALDATARDMHLANAVEHDRFADWLEDQKDNAEATL